MQAIREITQRKESSSLAVRSDVQLSAAESEALTVLLDQMAAHYPHQTFPDETGEIWREAFEAMAKKYTLLRLRKVLGEFLIRPGQKFFPHPGEVSEAIEELMAKEREQFLKDHPWEPCSNCMNGMVIVERDGRRIAVRCECWKAWKRSTQEARQTVDAKMKAAGS